MYHQSQEDTKKYEARISNYGMHAVEEDSKISEAHKRLTHITREAKKLILEEKMNK